MGWRGHGVSLSESLKDIFLKSCVKPSKIDTNRRVERTGVGSLVESLTVLPCWEVWKIWRAPFWTENLTLVLGSHKSATDTDKVYKGTQSFTGQQGIMLRTQKL